MAKRFIAAATLFTLISFTGCRKDTIKVISKKPTVVVPTVDAASVQANELGRVPVVMYHDVNDVKIGKNTKMNRTKASFLSDLDYLHKNAFYPVTLRSFVDGSMDVPAGKSPVVITFDDARETQFRLIEQESTYDVDTESAYGMMEGFCKDHPEWKPMATFFVLPKSAKTMEPFGQTGLGDDKIQYLVSKSCEIGNHSLRHKSFSRMGVKELQDELSKAQEAIQSYVPQVKITSLATPYGVYPRNKAEWKYLMEGKGVGGSYSHTAVCQAAWRPTLPPGAKGFNPLRIDRITPEDVKFGLKYWVDTLVSGRMSRYVSDGDASVISYPKLDASNANTALLKQQGKTINAYGAVGAAGGKKIIGVTDPSSAVRRIAEPTSKPISGSGK